MLEILYVYTPFPSKQLDGILKTDSARRIINHSHSGFIPNTLLKILHKNGKINLTEYPITKSKELINILNLTLHTKIDIIIFGLLQFDYINKQAAEIIDVANNFVHKHAVTTINLHMHCKATSDYKFNGALLESEFPKIAKPICNWTIKDNNFFIIEDKIQLSSIIKNKSDHIDNFLLEDFYQPPKRDNGFYEIERWTYICGDLTVSIRQSKDKIIKYLNSVQWTYRDPRLLNHEFEILVDRKLRTKNTIHGISTGFAYDQDSTWWDKRYRALNSFLADKAGLDICTLDVINYEDELKVIDYNELTFETGPDGLLLIWSNRVLDHIKSKLT